MCGCKYCISDKSMHSLLPSWRGCCLKTLKDLSQNAQNRRSGERSNRIHDTFKNTVMPHGRHIYTKLYYMEKATMCANSQSDHALPHWKCVLRCCTQCPSINIPVQETDDNHTNPSP